MSEGKEAAGSSLATSTKVEKYQAGVEKAKVETVGAVSPPAANAKGNGNLLEESKQRSQDVIAGAQSLLVVTVLGLACVVAFSSRLFAVIRFESIIHEFDPWWVCAVLWACLSVHVKPFEYYDPRMLWDISLMPTEGLLIIMLCFTKCAAPLPVGIELASSPGRLEGKREKTAWYTLSAHASKMYPKSLYNVNCSVFNYVIQLTLHCSRMIYWSVYEQNTKIFDAYADSIYQAVPPPPPPPNGLGTRLALSHRCLLPYSLIPRPFPVFITTVLTAVCNRILLLYRKAYVLPSVHTCEVGALVNRVHNARPCGALCRPFVNVCRNS